MAKDNGLKGYWIVGDVVFKNGTASVVVAKAKTAARQSAERRLLRAEGRMKSAKAIGYDRKHQARFGVTGKTDLDFARAFVSRWGKTGASDLYRYTELILRHEGVRLTGPHGETELVTEPSKKMRAEREARDRKWERHDKAMVGAMVRGIRPAR